MTEDEFKECFSVLNDAWKLIREYGNRENSDEYWSGLVNSVGIMVGNHHNTTFASDIGTSVIQLMTDVMKQKTP